MPDCSNERIEIARIERRAIEAAVDGGALLLCRMDRRASAQLCGAFMKYPG